MPHPLLTALLFACSLLPGVQAFAESTSVGRWAPVAWANEQVRSAPGVTHGGEGGQVALGISVGGPDGAFVLYGTDVGGLFRSDDGGDTWEPGNTGMAARGVCAFAIDPNQPRRVLAVGVNSLPHATNGLYLSTDAATSWSHVLPAPIAGMRDLRDQIAFDPHTLDPGLGHSTDAYWSRVADDKSNFGKLQPDPALYRSSDGGASWNRLPGSEPYAGGTLVVDPVRRGVLWVANETGVYVSTDRGESFERRMEGSTTGLAISADRPDRVFVSHPGGLKVSEDRGGTWRELPALTRGDDRQEVRYQQVSVSPADPDRIALRSTAKSWRFRAHVSHDAGETWMSAKFDRELAFLPQNARQTPVAWHPHDPAIAYSFGGDWPTRSTDGGRRFSWHGDGVNGILVGGAFHFDPDRPGVVFMGSQDYNGALTTDGGETWSYLNAAGKGWGGFTYGGVAADERTMFVGVAANWGADRVLSLSRDGGETWTSVPEVRWSKDRKKPDAFGHDSSFVQPAVRGVVGSGRAVFFAGPFRSDDGGRAWTRMEGVQGVLTSTRDASGAVTLYGAHRPASGASRVVASTDAGRSWQTLAEVDGDVNDLAADPATGRVYVAAADRLHVVEAGTSRRLETPKDARGGHGISSVATDPSRPGRVYAAQHMNTHAASPGTLMSGDGGETWDTLDGAGTGEAGGPAGGREPIRVRVHPVTGEAWFSTSCHGLWKFIPADTH